jgi:hypothetical protein
MISLQSYAEAEGSSVAAAARTSSEARGDEKTMS